MAPGSRGTDLRVGASCGLGFMVAHRCFPLIFNRVERGYRDAAGATWIVRALQRRQERRSTFSHDPVARERAKRRMHAREGVHAERFIRPEDIRQVDEIEISLERLMIRSSLRNPSF